MTLQNTLNPAVVSAVKTAKMCEGLIPEQVEALAALFTLFTVKMGEDFIKHDERGNEVFIIVQGSVEVEIPLVGQKDTSAIAKLGAGDSVGEFALLREARRSASAHSIAESTLVRAKSDEILNLFNSQPAMGYCVCRNLGRILVDRLEDTNMQLRGALSR